MYEYIYNFSPYFFIQIYLFVTIFKLTREKNRLLGEEQIRIRKFDSYSFEEKKVSNNLFDTLLSFNSYLTLLIMEACLCDYSYE